MTHPTCTIISIGDELLLGLTLDTNAHYLAGHLTEIGWRIGGVQVVDDSEAAIVRAIQHALEMSELILITGGLGPTEDDRTRAAVANVLAVPLEERAELRVQIEARMKSRNRTIPPNNLRQALIPQGADGIENPCGTAPGIHCVFQATEIYVLPGVPFEMREMFTRSVLPHIAERVANAAVVVRRIHLFGLGESTVGAAIAGHMQTGANPEVGITVKENVITIRALARSPDLSTAETLAGDLIAEVAEVFSEHVIGYDDENFPRVIVNLLRQRGETIALAESCTGGMLASLLIGVPGSSEVFIESAVTYANAAKVRVLGVSEDMLKAEGAVSFSVAAAMAEGIRNASGADWALSITGIAGPDGGTKEKPVGTVYLALSGAGCIVKVRREFGSDRTGNRVRAALTALDLLRREMSDLTIPWEYMRERR